MKKIIIHRSAQKEFDGLNLWIRHELYELLRFVALGEIPEFPTSRPMPVIANGVHELRLNDHLGRIRVFYYVKRRDAILLLHVLEKKSQKTPLKSIRITKKRLKEML